MTWDYRVIRRLVGVEARVEYAIHRVHYHKDGTIKKYTKRPVTARGCTPDELRARHGKMLEAFLKPILDFKEFGTR